MPMAPVLKLVIYFPDRNFLIILNVHDQKSEGASVLNTDQINTQSPKYWTWKILNIENIETGVLIFVVILISCCICCSRRKFLCALNHMNTKFYALCL